MDSRLWNRRQIDRDLDIRRKQTFPMMHCKRTVTTMQCAHDRVLKILFLRHWMFWLQKILNFKDLTTAIWKRKTVHLFSSLSFSSFFRGLESPNVFVRIQVSERTLGEITLRVKEWLLIHIWPSLHSMAVLSSRAHERRSREKNKNQLLPPQSPRVFSALARLYYLATKTAMLRRLYPTLTEIVLPWGFSLCNRITDIDLR